MTYSYNELVKKLRQDVSVSDNELHHLLRKKFNIPKVGSGNKKTYSHKEYVLFRKYFYYKNIFYKCEEELINFYTVEIIRSWNEKTPSTHA